MWIGDKKDPHPRPHFVRTPASLNYTSSAGNSLDLIVYPFTNIIIENNFTFV